MATQPRLTQASKPTPTSNTFNGLGDERLKLPTGACNFTNLNGGGPRCGCRRFWDRRLGDGGGQQDGGTAKAGWCMCEHHACFHDFGPGEGQDAGAIQDAVLSSSNQAIREVEAAAELDNQDHNIPDTYNWRSFVKNGSSIGSLPPIPSQCLLPSDSGSEGTASQARYSRPFAGVGLQTLSHIPKPIAGGSPSPARHVEATTPNERAIQLYEDSPSHTHLQSLTDGGTPTHQALLDATAPGRPNRESSLPRGLDRVTSRSPDYNNEGQQLMARLDKIISQVTNYPHQMENHEHRLDQLENVSFSNSGLEDLQEKIDQMDAHIVELESKLEEMERTQAAAMNDHSSISSKVDGSFVSGMTTTSSAMMASAIDRMEFSSRIESLESEIQDLKAAAQPSYTRPWEVEVVFVPYGSHLAGIWSTDHPSAPLTRSNSGCSDGWTQSQYNSLAVAQAQARLAALNDSVAWEDGSTTGDHQGNTWLMPRACGRRSKVDERLRSRGLVRTIQIRGPDARDVQVAMLSAFGDLLATINGQSFEKHATSHIPDSLSGYIGLQATWIPLRKLHKDSRLRFLDPSEMVTPALWTVPFLASSVAMRTSGPRRLYVTHRDSYIQHLGSTLTEWSWQKLRELPRIYPDDEANSGDTPEADAQEPCWEYDERLDPPLSALSSFSSLHLSGTTGMMDENVLPPASPSDHFSSAPASRSHSTTPTSTALAFRALPPLKERQPFALIHKRTASLPTLAIKTSPLINKRRIASFEQASPVTASSSNMKRRRLSRSPSRPDDTPWSIGPPSPYFEDDAEQKRGSTPFAYATPHSNAPYIEASRPRSGAGEHHIADGDDDNGSTTDDFDLDEDEDDDIGKDDSGDDDDGLDHDYDYYDSDDDAAFVDDQGHQPDGDWRKIEVSSHDTAMHSSKQEPIKVYEDEVESDDDSDSSSQPSEYPFTQEHHESSILRERLVEEKNDPGFQIHVDEGVEETE